ncbi:polyprenyl synthetase family protein [Actinotalea sp. AC32]|nr:polyprenyl synthetase family protein [Actinotalea sp. AC32]
MTLTFTGPAPVVGDEQPRWLRAAQDQQAVDALLARVLEQARGHALAFGPEYGLVWSELARSVRGGKRFRSAIVLGTHAALSGSHDDAAVAVAAGFELLHTAFLVHDDLIDHDWVRRGEPNLAATMRATSVAGGSEPAPAQEWSEAAAVLAGDLALSRAHRLVAGVDVVAARREQLLDLLDETLLVSAGGELADTAYGLGLRVPTLDQALLVCESKTAMYSFRAPLRAGAILAGASQRTQAELDHVGRLLGRAFQLVDDLLGVFAPEESIGKSNISDLREGKHTALILHAQALPVWQDVADGFGDPDLDRTRADAIRVALAGSAAPGLVEQHVRADLAEVASRCDEDVLGPDLCAFVRTIADRVAGALDDVVGHVEAVRCAAA